MFRLRGLPAARAHARAYAPLALLLLALAPLHVQAQQTQAASLSGRVVDQNSAAVSGAA